jgi:hypothetical protein
MSTLMETVLVQVPSPDGGPPSQVVHVGPGERVRFGRSGAQCEVDIELIALHHGLVRHEHRRLLPPR